MTLSNVAWVLASQGNRVLMVDWDLEAPGLHRYFRPFLTDAELSATDGIIDMVIEYCTDAVTASTAAREDWYHEYADPSRYAVMLNRFENGGRLDLLAAGRQGWSYSVRVNTFDWRDFYEAKGGGAFLEAVEARMREQYDYVLIDSRTGVSDTSGICTVQFPDALVVCFTLNDQSIEGASAVAASVLEQRKDSPPQIYPMPMRVELAEKEKLERRRELSRTRFTLFPNSIPEGEARDRYWRRVETLYVPFYAYEEIIATIGDKPGHTSSLLAAAEHLSEYVSDGAVTKMAPLPEAKRLELLARYERQSRTLPEESLGPEAEGIYARLPAAQQTVARQLFTRLVYIARPGKGGRDTPVPAPASDLPFLNAPENGGLNAFFASGILRMELDAANGQALVAITSPALLTRWDRLARWIREDRAFLAWRQQLEDSRRTWEESSHKDQTVLLGAALSEAQRWAGERSTELTPAERDYVHASLKAKERAVTSRQMRYTVVGAVVIALIVTLLAIQLGTSREDRAIDAIALADDLIAKGQTDSALSVLNGAVELGSELPGAWQRRGELLLRKLQPGPARDDFDRTIALDSANASAWFGRALANDALANRNEAINDYSRTITLDSSNLDAFFNRGVLYQADNETILAANDFQRVLDLNPTAQTRDATIARLGQLGYTNTGPSYDTPPVVAIHYADRSDEPIVRELQKALVGAGFDVPGIEYRTEPTPGDVRSFFPRDRAIADSVAATVELALGRQGYRIRLERLTPDSLALPTATRGHVELWLPPLQKAIPSAIRRSTGK
jgi:tetratricopeptide (TPR) repeat protein